MALHPHLLQKGHGIGALTGLMKVLSNAIGAHMAVVKAVLGSHFGVGEFTTHFGTYCSGDWDVHWGDGILTHGHINQPQFIPRCVPGFSGESSLLEENTPVFKTGIDSYNMGQHYSLTAALFEDDAFCWIFGFMATFCDTRGHPFQTLNRIMGMGISLNRRTEKWALFVGGYMFFVGFFEREPPKKSPRETGPHGLLSKSIGSRQLCWVSDVLTPPKGGAF